METTWRVATFNMESLDEKPGADAFFATRQAALRPLFEGADADVWCLQEVNAQGSGKSRPRTFAALEHLIAGLECSSFHRANSVNPESGQPADVHNLVILSRWPIVKQWQTFHDLVPQFAIPEFGGDTNTSAIVRFDRPVLGAEIRAPFGPLHILNLHLRAPRAAPFATIGQGGRWTSNADWARGFHLAALKRQGQALEARLAADQIFESDREAAIAVCGDLNADLFETPTRILRGAPEDNAEGPLAQRALEPLDRRIPADRRFSVIHDSRKIMLDHILVSHPLERRFVRLHVLNEGLQDEALTQDPVAGSLHAPVIAEFTIGAGAN